MEISISTGLYYTKNYTEILDMISKTSCRNIELCLNQSFIDVPIDELEREVNKRELKVLSIHSPLEFIAFPRGENEEFWIEKCLHMTERFGSKVIVSHMVISTGVMEGIAQRELDEIHKANVLKYKKCQEVKNVCVTTENLPGVLKDCFLAKPNEFLSFIKDNEVSITFDTTHCAAGGFSILEKYSEVKSYIKNIHLSDFKDGAEHKLLGTGDLPLKEFISLLKKDNYSGILTIELDFDNKVRNDIESLEQAAKEIEKSIQFIKSCV